MDLQKEILESVNKHLPEQVAGVLKERLTTLEQIEIDHQDLLKEYEILVSKYKDLKEKEDRFNNLDKIDLDLRNANTVLKKKEFEFENNKRIFELTTQLNAEKESKNFAQDLAMGLVRNTDYKKTTLSNGNTLGPGFDHYGNRESSDHSNSETITQSAE